MITVMKFLITFAIILWLPFISAKTCRDQRVQDMKDEKIYDDVVPVDCDIKGKYKVKQCDKEGCYCVDRETGIEIEESYQFGKEDPKCKTKCEKEYAMRLVIKSRNYVPVQCDSYGDYKRTQCNSEGCYCVDPISGERINDSLFPLRENAKCIKNARNNVLMTWK